MLKLVGFFLACAFLVLVGAQPASAQLSVTTYATGMGSPATLDFDVSGALFAGQVNEDDVHRAPPGGGAGARYLAQATYTNFAAVVGPDNAVYVSEPATGRVLRYAPGNTTPDPVPYGSGLPPSAYIALAFGPGGQLYAASSGSTVLFVIPAGGGVTTIHGSGLSFGFDALAVGQDGSVYATASMDTVIKRIGPGGGAAVDFATGVPAEPYALAIDQNGALYAAGFADPTVYRVGPAGGAVSPFVTLPASSVASLTFAGGTLYAGSSATGIVYAVSQATPPPAGVPTLSEWAVFLLGFMMAGGAAAILSRRRPA